jgi:hypothetical protein
VAFARSRPPSIQLLGGCQSVIGVLVLAAFTIGTVGADFASFTVRHVAVGALFGFYCASWIAAGIGLVLGRAWAWWLSGFVLVIALLRELFGLGVLLQGISDGSVVLPANDATALVRVILQPLLVASPLLVWQSQAVRAWCRVQVPLHRAVLGVALFTTLVYSAFVHLVLP